MDIQELLRLTVANKASDLHLMPEIPPAVRIDGNLMYLPNISVLSPESIQSMMDALMTAEQRELLKMNKELDFSVGFGGGLYGNEGRFRINAYHQKGSLCAAMRYLPKAIATIDDLHLPKICHTFAELKHGLVLVVGPTGHGKSTTLAAIINEINQSKANHILTIEDPIEYIYPKGKSILSQREIKTDTNSWGISLRSALREDPDVILVGEMRDPETIAATITLAETGHLVFSTLHTNSAAQSLDRIIDSFPSHEQNQIRMQLAFTLRGVISQRLLPQLGGGRIPAVEVLLGTPAVANNIREGKTHLIDSIIQTSQEMGMISLESSLAQLVLSGLISLDTAKTYALHLDEFLHLVK